MLAAAATTTTLATTHKDGTLAPTSTTRSTITASIYGLATTSQILFPFSRLPRELQDRIYVYMSSTTWISSAHTADKE